MAYASLFKNTLIKLIALAVAAAIWLPCLHLLYRPDAADYRAPDGIAPKARMLAARHLNIWTDPALRRLELQKMQANNPEWDFMSRTYFVLALSNMALRDPAAKDQACEIMDVIIDNTLRIERERGINHFLLGYAQTTGPWVMQPPRSQFVDGEIALMLAARRMVIQRQLLFPVDDNYNSLSEWCRKHCAFSCFFDLLR